MNREVVTLCGSTRFPEAFRKANYELTLAGKIVLSVGCDTKSDAGLSITDQQKRELDELHLDKIDLSTSVLVLNVGGYIGESTRREIGFALIRGKKLRFLEEMTGEEFLEKHSHEIARLGLEAAKARGDL